MRAIEFRQSNTRYPTVIKRFGGKKILIPAHRENGLVTTVWKANFKEWLKFIFSGKIYHTQACVNQPMQAVALNMDNPFEKKTIKK